MNTYESKLRMPMLIHFKMLHHQNNKTRFDLEVPYPKQE